jgi:subtilase family serine protease
LLSAQKENVAHSNTSLEVTLLQRFDRFLPFLSACVAAVLLCAAPAEASGQQVLPGHVPRAVADSRALNKLPDATRLNLAIGLPLRNQGELDELLAQLADPESAQFGHYLSAEQFAAEFGPTEHDYQALIQFAHENGLAVTGTHPNRVLLDVSGRVSDIEKVMHIRMMVYEHPVRGKFFAPDREPSLDVAVPVLDISGLDNFELPHPMSLKNIPLSEAKSYVTGSGPGGYFIGRDFRAAYAPGVTVTGSGQVVGLLEFDGFYAGDVQKNAAAAGLPVVPTQTVLLDGFSGAPGGANIEVILDIMMASYMAPGLSKVMVYEGSNPNDILNRMATDNLAQQLSSSWGYGPINATTEQIFKQYIAQGQSMMQASGDSGAYTNGVMAPSDDPNLTVVGGTSLTTAGAGGPWQSEKVWSGSGGGVSTLYPIPSYQQGLNMAANRGSTKMRNIPDVALTADIQMFLIQSNGQAVVVGGTSAAAPLWSGFVALANQQAAANAKPRIGFLNPLLYTIGEHSNYAADMNDITSGSNGGFSAVTGYDLTTGWGSPAGQHLINDLTGSTGEPSFLLSTSAAALTITPASTGAATLTVTATNGFSGSVSLAVSGMPSGVTAAFSPAATTSTSKVTFTASASAHSGTYPLTVTGVSGSLSNTTAIALTVVVPSFTLSSSASSLTVPRGSNGTSTISVAGQNGFSGSVALAVSGMPNGVTAAFSPASTTSKSGLTFNANSAAAAGTYTVTVTGVSGALTSSTTIGLTITAPNFTLSFTGAALGEPRGSTAAGAVTIIPQNGFNSSVSLSASGLPSGVTAAFGAPSTAGTSQATFTASSTATVGSFPITVHGVSGALSSSATFTLTVLLAPSGASLVNLAPAYNINALVMDGLPFTGSGLDGGLNGSSTAYSANLIGVQQTLAGTLFYFGPANAPDAVSAKTVSLPSGQFSRINLLATGVNGSQTAQVFKVTYTDGTASTFTQNLSDWFTPQNFAGETKGLTMPYRDNGQGQKDNRTFYLYEYTFALTASKTVASITLPNNRNVVVLAASLSNATPSIQSKRLP